MPVCVRARARVCSTHAQECRESLDVHMILMDHVVNAGKVKKSAFSNRTLRCAQSKVSPQTFLPFLASHTSPLLCDSWCTCVRGGKLVLA